MNPERAAISRTDGKVSHTVLFNPASLKVTLTNNHQDKDSSGGKGTAVQTTKGTTSKLETELVYDTTDVGLDVRDKTFELKTMALTSGVAKGAAPAAPPEVEFRWGLFSYKGVIESVTETLDFWAQEGVPLRATIQLVIQNDKVDDSVKEGDGNESQITLNPLPTGGTGATGVAANAGDPSGGRAIAAANGMESMRFSAGASVAVSAGVQLQAAAGFSIGVSAGIGASAGIGFGIGASAGGGIGIGGGAGIGASAGLGGFAGASAGASASAGAFAGASASAGASAGAGAFAGASAGAGAFADASAGFGASAGASFGASASAGFSGVTSYGTSGAFVSGSSVSFGASATAGVSASDGAFAGLGVSSATLTPYRLDPMRMLPPPVLISGQVTQFDVTGRAIVTSSSGLSANVGGGVRFI
jgi:hypothetical protein